MSLTSITSKVYRYDALLQAIDFFTQRFSVELLSKYSFEFTNEILTLNASALFILENNEFIMKASRLYDISGYSIKNDIKIQNIATFHGNVIYNNFEHYFNNEEIELFCMELVIPLIIDDKVCGFIVSNGKILGKFEDDDYVIALALMRLFNNSLENSRNFEELKGKNKQLDQKIFNLFAINQSSKTLLSELNLEKLYTMATDVFGEIACSRVTSFGINDELTNKVKIIGYRNVENFSKHYTELALKTSNYNYMKTVLNINDDIEIIRSIFSNWEELLGLEAKYVVLIVKDKLLGIVTISDPVNDIKYDASLFELIESLASFTYIAFSNALLFKEIKVQKNILEKKFKTLSNLNALVKNINHCVNIDELCEITLKTLNAFFGVKKAFIAFRDKEIYMSQYSQGNVFEGLKFNITEAWSDTLLGETIYDYDELSIEKYFSDELLKDIKDTNCVVISPILLDNSSLEESMPLGYLIVLETNQNLQQEHILLIDTITKNITPIIYNMKWVEESKKKYIINEREAFLSSLNSKIKEEKEYKLDYNLYYMKINKHPFQNPELSEFIGYEHYVIDNYVFIISYDDITSKQLTKLSNPRSIEDFLTYQF